MSKTLSSVLIAAALVAPTCAVHAQALPEGPGKLADCFAHDGQPRRERTAGSAGGAPRISDQEFSGKTQTGRCGSPRTDARFDQGVAGPNAWLAPA